MQRLNQLTPIKSRNNKQRSLFVAAALSLSLGSLFFSYNVLANDTNNNSAQAYQQNSFTQAQLEQMLAPIALYPDSVLTHILIASTYPIEIIQASRWLDNNAELDASDALEEVEDKEWDPSVKALVAFPRVLERLSNDLDWTQNLGDAFLQDEKGVLNSIQSLRSRADQAGNLDKMDNMKVSRENKTIIIQSAEPEVVYVPYYDTRVVYGRWHWAHHQPVYWDWSWHNSHNHYGHHYTPHHGLFSWHPRIRLRHHYYFSAFNWHNHHVVVVNGRHFNSRRYRHRSDIIAHANARRWDHNPRHRRGVAYRNNQVRERYSSARPSRVETRAVRATERNRARTDRQVRNNNNRSNNRVRNDESDRRVNNRNSRTINNRNINNRRVNNNASRATESNTRSQRLRDQLANERSTNRNSNRSANSRSQVRTDNNDSRSNQRNSRVIRNNEQNQTRSDREVRQQSSSQTRQTRQVSPVKETRPARETRPERESRPVREVRPQREERAKKESRSRPQRNSRPARESRSRNDGRRSRGDRN